MVENTSMSSEGYLGVKGKNFSFFLSKENWERERERRKLGKGEREKSRREKKTNCLKVYK